MEWVIHGNPYLLPYLCTTSYHCNHILHGSHFWYTALYMLLDSVFKIAKPIVEIQWWIFAIDKQPQPLDLVDCATTARPIATKLCTFITV